MTGVTRWQMRRFVDGAKNRYCEIAWEGLHAEVRSGRVGTEGRTSARSFATDAEVAQHVQSTAARKLREGYGEVEPAPQLATRRPDEPQATAAPDWLAKVAAAPDKDEPRLVYADWLTAQGDPRGELIVVQCELARMDPWENVDRERLLRGLERKLLQAFSRRWLDEIEVRAEFRRGFVEHAAVDVQSLPALRLLFEQAPLLRSVALVGEGWPSPPWSALPEEHLHRVTALSLANLPLTEADAVLLGSGDGPPRLVELDVTGCGLLPPSATALARHPFTRLVLAGNRIATGGVTDLATSPTLASLRTLDVGDTYLREEAVLALAASPHLQRLERLGLAHANVGRGNAAALGAAFPSLRHLDLSSNPSVRDALTALLGGPGLTSLRSLDLSSCRLGDDGALALVAAPRAAQLTWLDLRKTHLTPASVATLAAAPSLSNLRYLAVSEGKMALSRSPHLSRAFIDARKDG